jgi:hypothetical protein
MRSSAAIKPAIAFLLAAAAALPARADLTASLGGFEPERSDPASRGGGYVLGMSVEQRRPSGLRLAFEATYFGASYLTPAGLTCGLLCTVHHRMSLTVLGFGAGIGHGFRLGAADLYAGVGLGLYFSEMTATATTFGLPAENDEHDTGVGADFRAGVAFDLGNKHGLGIEYRRLSLRAKFGARSNGRSLPLGGAFVQGFYRKFF